MRGKDAELGMTSLLWTMCTEKSPHRWRADSFANWAHSHQKGLLDKVILQASSSNRKRWCLSLTGTLKSPARKWRIHSYPQLLVKILTWKTRKFLSIMVEDASKGSRLGTSAVVAIATAIPTGLPCPSEWISYMKKLVLSCFTPVGCAALLTVSMGTPPILTICLHLGCC